MESPGGGEKFNFLTFEDGGFLPPGAIPSAKSRFSAAVIIVGAIIFRSVTGRALVKR